MFVDQAAILRERSQHHAVHAHPANERRSSAFVEAIDAFFSDSLEEAIERALELRVRLEADLDRIEWMTLQKLARLQVLYAIATSVKMFTQHLASLHQKRHPQRIPCTGRREQDLWPLFRHSC